MSVKRLEASKLTRSKVIGAFESTQCINRFSLLILNKYLIVWLVNRRFTDQSKTKPLITLQWWREICLPKTCSFCSPIQKDIMKLFLFTQNDKAKHFPSKEDSVLWALYWSTKDHMLRLLFNTSRWHIYLLKQIFVWCTWNDVWKLYSPKEGC